MGFTPDLVWYVSDNESWVDSARAAAYASYFASRSGGKTTTMSEWDKVKVRNPKAKLICMDLSPNTTTQAPSRDDILNMGGFSDTVFEVAATFQAGMETSWTAMIENAVGDLL
jgi:60 kDa SS-A/Ro ribonucleoprotein